MISMDTNFLVNIDNGQQRRRKVAQTYGKKNGRLSRFQPAQQNIFKHDIDEDIENRFAKLTIQKSEWANKPKSIVPSCQPKKATQQKPNSTAKALSTDSCDARTGLEPKPEHPRADQQFKNLFDLAGSDGFESFASFGSKLSKHFAIEKIGEGSFAEVFKLTALSSLPLSSQKEEHPIFDATGAKSPLSSQTPSLQKYNSIIKVIPLKDTKSSSSVPDRCSSVESVGHEIEILKQLDPVHGFTRFRGLRLVKGLWPASFLDAFYDFRRAHRRRAINAPPDVDFDDEQMYAMVEMDDAGTEISLIKRPSVFQVWDIFWICAILLANAEECIEFEHRDLHMSNICVKAAGSVVEVPPSFDKGSLQPSQKVIQHSTSPDLERTATSAPELDIKLDVLQRMTQVPKNKIGLSDLRVTVIDYTVARACLSSEDDVEPSPSKSSKSKFGSTRRSICSNKGDSVVDDNIIFDPMIFTSDPFASDLEDIESHVQNLTYKKTRAIAKQKQQSQRSSMAAEAQTSHDKWHAFIPRTNVVWLGYLLRILIHRARGRTGKLHLLKGKTGGKEGNNKLVKQVQEQMWTTLQEVSKMINGNDYREHENQNTSSDGRIRKDRQKQCLRSKGSEQEMEEPSWTEADLEDLPGSSMAVLEIAVQKGWLSAEDIQSFKAVLEKENS